MAKRSARDIRGELILRYGTLEAAAAAFRKQGLGLGIGKGDAKYIDFKALTYDIYAAYWPQRLPMVPELLLKYEGRPGGLAELCALAIEQIVE